jgi:uncharacterized membrane protein YccF (DUF307 family)
MDDIRRREPLVAPGPPPGAGSLLLNILWFVLAGFWLALSYVLAGVIQCLFIITIPFGVQCFKLAGFALWPFGRAVVKRPDRSRALGAIGNLIWFFFAGIWLALAHFITGILLCLTIIGLPLGVANLKMIGLALLPFGKDVVPRGQAYGSSVSF